MTSIEPPPFGYFPLNNSVKFPLCDFNKETPSATGSPTYRKLRKRLLSPEEAVSLRRGHPLGLWLDEGEFLNILSDEAAYSAFWIFL